MSRRPDARLAPKGRETLVSRIEGGLGIGEAARQMGAIRQTAGRWLRRARRGESMDDRSGRPARIARMTPPEAEERVAAARRELLPAPTAVGTGRSGADAGRSAEPAGRASTSRPE